MQQYEGSLGTVEPQGIVVKLKQALGFLPLFGPNQCPLPSQVREVQVRNVQLTELLRNRELAVRAEVDAVLISWKSSLETWASTNHRVKSWEQQLDRLTQKQPVDETITWFDLAQARLGILEAKADRLKALAECRQAQVKLWTAQGTVGAGCGWPGHPPDWCETRQSAYGFAPPETPSLHINQPPPETLPRLIPQPGTEKPPAAPAPKLTPMSGNFRPSAHVGLASQGCKPTRLIAR